MISMIPVQNRSNQIEHSLKLVLASFNIVKLLIYILYHNVLAFGGNVPHVNYDICFFSILYCRNSEISIIQKIGKHQVNILI